MLALRPLLLTAACAVGFSTAAPAQGVGGMLNSAKAKVGQARGASTASSVAQAAAKNCAGDPPAAPGPNDLTVDNNIAWTQAVLANCRPYLEGTPSESDNNWRRLHFEYKAPLRFTWDRAYVEQLTPKGFYLMGQIEVLSLALLDWYKPNSDWNAEYLPKFRKVKEIHLTTTTQLPHGPGSEQGYVLGWNQATGVLFIAISNPPNRPRDLYFSNLHQEELIGFMKANIK